MIYTIKQRTFNNWGTELFISRGGSLNLTWTAVTPEKRLQLLVAMM